MYSFKVYQIVIKGVKQIAWGIPNPPAAMFALKVLFTSTPPTEIINSYVDKCIKEGGLHQDSIQMLIQEFDVVEVEDFINHMNGTDQNEKTEADAPKTDEVQS
jgi:hypothetical protein